MQTNWRKNVFCRAVDNILQELRTGNNCQSFVLLCEISAQDHDINVLISEKLIKMEQNAFKRKHY